MKTKLRGLIAFFAVAMMMLVSVFALAACPGDDDDEDPIVHNFVVSFVDASNTHTNIPQQTIASGALATRPALSTPNYTYHWFREAGFINEWNFAVNTVATDLTLHLRRTYDGSDENGGELPTDTEAVTAARDAITWDSIRGTNTLESEVTVNLASLPLTGLYSTTIAWVSNNTAVVSNAGVVTRPSFSQGDANVVLTASITRGEISQDEVFNLVVLAYAQTDTDRVAAARDAITWDSIRGENILLSEVTQNLASLPLTGLYDTTITWTSNNTAVVSNAGVVTRPSFLDGNADIILTALIELNDAYWELSFHLTVLALEPSDIEAVAAAADDIDWDMIRGQNTLADEVSFDLDELALAGAHGTVISWQSSDVTVVSNIGAVTRPSFSVGDVDVVLTATITRGEASKTIDFDLTVLALEPNDIEAVELAKAALDWDVIRGQNDLVSAVVYNLVLNTTGLHNTTIAWSSSVTDSLTNAGVVTRPMYLAGNASVVLTATITRGTETREVVFDIVIISHDISNQEAFELAANNLTWAHIRGQNVLYSDVTANLVVLPVLAAHGIAISWNSSNLNFVAINGAVTRPSYTQGDQSVVLTATLTRAGTSDNVVINFNLTITALDINNQEAVNLTATALVWDSIREQNINQNEVISNLNLPNTGANSTMIVWVSHNTAFMTNAGVVTRPSYTQGAQTNRLVATISRGGFAQTVVFDLTILPLAPTDAEAVAASIALVNWNAIRGENLNTNAVTSNLNFAITAVHGASIVWGTSAANVVSNTGEVNRPSYLTGNAGIILTVTVVRGTASLSVEFSLVVLANEITNEERMSLALLSLTWDSIRGANIYQNQVSVNLRNMVTELFGVSIVWSSNNVSVLSNIGVVTQPSFAIGSVSVALRATLTIGTLESNVDFNITVLALSDYDDQEAIASAYAWLVWARIAGTNAAINQVTDNLNLVTQGPEGTTIAWATANAGVVDAAGVVFRPSRLLGNVQLVLTATISRGAHSVTREFVVTVLYLMTDAEAVEEAESLLTWAVIANTQNIANVTQDLDLVVGGQNWYGVTISWASNNTAISNDGVVTRPSFIQGNSAGTIVATISRGAASAIVSFNPIVLANEITNQEALYLARLDLTFASIAGGNDLADDIRYRLAVLPVMGLHNVTIVWASSNTSVVSNTGLVFRPSYTQGNQAIVLTATLSIGGLWYIAEFNLTITANPITDQEAIAIAVSQTVWDSIRGQNTLASAVVQNLGTLPLTANHGVEIEWLFSYAAYGFINSLGHITRPSYIVGNIKATLYAYISRGNHFVVVEFELVILALPMTNQEAVNLAAAALGFEGIDLDAVVLDLTLPSAGLNDTIITWTSSHAAVSNTGIVTRPLFGQNAQAVILTARIERNGTYINRVFNLVVSPMLPTDAEAVAAMALNVVWNAIRGQNTYQDRVSFNLVIPTTNQGMFDTTITWSSSNINIITNNGIVIPPAVGADNASIVLSVTVSRGEVSQTIVFNLTVLALQMTYQEAVEAARIALDLGNIDRIISDMTLPSIGLHGTLITWASSNTDYVTNTGAVTRPAFGDGNIEIELVATITRGGVSQTRRFVATILETEPGMLDRSFFRPTYQAVHEYIALMLFMFRVELYHYLPHYGLDDIANADILIAILEDEMGIEFSTRNFASIDALWDYFEAVMFDMLEYYGEIEYLKEDLTIIIFNNTISLFGDSFIEFVYNNGVFEFDFNEIGDMTDVGLVLDGNRLTIGMTTAFGYAFERRFYFELELVSDAQFNIMPRQNAPSNPRISGDYIILELGAYQGWQRINVYVQLAGQNDFVRMPHAGWTDLEWCRETGMEIQIARINTIELGLGKGINTVRVALAGRPSITRDGVIVIWQGSESFDFIINIDQIIEQPGGNLSGFSTDWWSMDRLDWDHVYRLHRIYVQRQGEGEYEYVMTTNQGVVLSTLNLEEGDVVKVMPTGGATRQRIEGNPFGTTPAALINTMPGAPHRLTVIEQRIVAPEVYSSLELGAMSFWLDNHDVPHIDIFVDIFVQDVLVTTRIFDAENMLSNIVSFEELGLAQGINEIKVVARANLFMAWDDTILKAMPSEPVVIEIEIEGTKTRQAATITEFELDNWGYLAWEPIDSIDFAVYKSHNGGAFIRVHDRYIMLMMIDLNELNLASGQWTFRVQALGGTIVEDGVLVSLTASEFAFFSFAIHHMDSTPASDFEVVGTNLIWQSNNAQGTLYFVYWRPLVETCCCHSQWQGGASAYSHSFSLASLVWMWGLDYGTHRIRVVAGQSNRWIIDGQDAIIMSPTASYFYFDFVPARQGTAPSNFRSMPDHFIVWDSVSGWYTWQIAVNGQQRNSGSISTASLDLLWALEQAIWDEDDFNAVFSLTIIPQGGGTQIIFENGALSFVTSSPPATFDFVLVLDEYNAAFIRQDIGYVVAGDMIRFGMDYVWVSVNGGDEISVSRYVSIARLGLMPGLNTLHVITGDGFLWINGNIVVVALFYDYIQIYIEKSATDITIENNMFFNSYGALFGANTSMYWLYISRNGAAFERIDARLASDMGLVSGGNYVLRRRSIQVRWVQTDAGFLYGHTRAYFAFDFAQGDFEYNYWFIMRTGDQTIAWYRIGVVVNLFYTVYINRGDGFELAAFGYSSNGISFVSLNLVGGRYIIRVVSFSNNWLIIDGVLQNGRSIGYFEFGFELVNQEREHNFRLDTYGFSIMFDNFIGTSYRVYVLRDGNFEFVLNSWSHISFGSLDLSQGANTIRIRAHRVYLDGDSIINRTYWQYWSFNFESSTVDNHYSYLYIGRYTIVFDSSVWVQYAYYHIFIFNHENDEWWHMATFVGGCCCSEEIWILNDGLLFVGNNYFMFVRNTAAYNQGTITLVRYEFLITIYLGTIDGDNHDFWIESWGSGYHLRWIHNLYGQYLSIAYRVYIYQDGWIFIEMSHWQYVLLTDLNLRQGLNRIRVVPAVGHSIFVNWCADYGHRVQVGYFEIYVEIEDRQRCIDDEYYLNFNLSDNGISIWHRYGNVPIFNVYVDRFDGQGYVLAITRNVWNHGGFVPFNLLGLTLGNNSIRLTAIGELNLTNGTLNMIRYIGGHVVWDLEENDIVIDNWFRLEGGAVVVNHTMFGGTQFRLYRDNQLVWAAALMGIPSNVIPFETFAGHLMGGNYTIVFSPNIEYGYVFDSGVITRGRRTGIVSFYFDAAAGDFEGVLGIGLQWTGYGLQNIVLTEPVGVPTMLSLSRDGGVSFENISPVSYPQHILAWGFVLGNEYIFRAQTPGAVFNFYDGVLSRGMGVWYGRFYFMEDALIDREFYIANNNLNWIGQGSHWYRVYVSRGNSAFEFIGIYSWVVNLNELALASGNNVVRLVRDIDNQGYFFYIDGIIANGLIMAEWTVYLDIKMNNANYDFVVSGNRLDWNEWNSHRIYVYMGGGVWRFVGECCCDRQFVRMGLDAGFNRIRAVRHGNQLTYQDGVLTISGGSVGYFEIMVELYEQFVSPHDFLIEDGYLLWFGTALLHRVYVYRGGGNFLNVINSWDRLYLSDIGHYLSAGNNILRFVQIDYFRYDNGVLLLSRAGVPTYFEFYLNSIASDPVTNIRIENGQLHWDGYGRGFGIALYHFVDYGWLQWSGTGTINTFLSIYSMINCCCVQSVYQFRFRIYNQGGFRIINGNLYFAGDSSVVYFYIEVDRSQASVYALAQVDFDVDVDTERLVWGAIGNRGVRIYNITDPNMYYYVTTAWSYGIHMSWFNFVEGQNTFRFVFEISLVYENGTVFIIAGMYADWTVHFVYGDFDPGFEFYVDVNGRISWVGYEGFGYARYVESIGFDDDIQDYYAEYIRVCCCLFTISQLWEMVGSGTQILSIKIVSFAPRVSYSNGVLSFGHSTTRWIVCIDGCGECN